MVKVAVYGTLREGFHNNYLLGKDRVFLGEASGNFPSVMYSAGGFPKLDLSKDFGLPPVEVEIYEVPEDIFLGNLDALEGYPDWYDRSEKEFTLKSGGTVTAWVYHQEVEGLPIVQTNDWGNK